MVAGKEGATFFNGERGGDNVAIFTKRGVGWEVAIFVKKIKLKSEIFNDKKSL